MEVTMKELKIKIMMISIVAFLLSFATISFSQWTKEQQDKINAAAKNAERIANNLLVLEEKFLWT
jgi:hypothetical protein